MMRMRDSHGHNPLGKRMPGQRPAASNLVGSAEETNLRPRLLRHFRNHYNESQLKSTRENASVVKRVCNQLVWIIFVGLYKRIAAL